ncbi:MAG: hypothetical protein HOD63_07130 [Bacteroidetes bacterium]|nr:hypothetical protein [Bacteroidota bacterium]MBT7828298.1 hypothetical protein [Bacteroidota bacterium]
MKFKSNSIFNLVSLLLFFAFIFINCNEEVVPPTKSKPVVETEVVSNIGMTTATCGGEVINDGNSSITERGVCWSKQQNPTVSDNKTANGAGTGSFVSELTQLDMNTTYYVKAYAINSIGTSYGSSVSFTTKDETVTDIDGNLYHVVTIGQQVWMVENLKVTRFRNGDLISNVTDQNQWYGLTTPALCYYDNDINYKATYGVIYNGYVVVDTRDICPEGWKIPSDQDFDELAAFLGYDDVAGGKLKETGTTHWEAPNTGATNETGFTALPCGSRGPISFMMLGKIAYWWSSYEKVTGHLQGRYIKHDEAKFGPNVNEKIRGFSIRCIKE